MRRGATAPFLVVAFSVIAGGWLLQEGVDRTENVYVRARLFQEVVQRVESSFVDEVDEGTLYNSAIDGLIRDLGDPHSSFLPASDFEDLRIRTEGEYGGVGLEVVDRGGYVTVVTPIPGGPATRVGIRAGDQFYEIDGVAADTMITEQAVELLRGRPGTEVAVRMLRPGVTEPIPFTLNREVILLKAVPFSFKLNDRVGYVPLQTVRESSSREVRAAIDSLQREGIEGLILDLRGNPGGLLDEGIAVTDLFLAEDAAIVETRGRADNQNDTYRASQPDRYPDLPLVVLVDATSASASEIIAGALQDHDRAVVMGETTYGKGSVQSLFRLTGGNVLRLTTAKWYTPVGRSIHVEPESRSPEAAHSLSITGQMITPVSIEGRPHFASMGGRTLYGGGGITPDVFVAPESLENGEIAAVQGLFSRAGPFAEALFRFSTTYVQERPGLQVDFRVSEADLDAFYQTFVEREVRIDRSDYELAERFVRYHLEREIALQAWGEGGQFQQTLRYDRQLQEALEILDGVSTPGQLIETTADAEEVPTP